MKVRSLFIAVPSLVFALVSCQSIHPLLDDDVYMTKTADVPIGEELADETSYANYKYRVNADAPTNGYYHQRNATVLNTQPLILGSGWYSYGRWNNFGTLSYMNSPYWVGYGNGFYGAPYMAWNNGYYYGSSFGYAYPWYGSYGWIGGNSHYYNSVLWSSGMPNYNYCYFGNGNPTNIYTGPPSTARGNFVSGPRSTAGGYYSGSNRGGTQKLKTASYIPNTTSTNGVAQSRMTRGTTRDARPQYSRQTTTVTRTNPASVITRSSGSIRTTTNSPTYRTTTSPTRTTTSGSIGGGRSSGSSGSSGGRSSGSSSGRSGGRGM